MAGTGSEEHRARARRARQLSDWAHEQAGGERAAAERSEHLMAEATDSLLIDLHRQAAALHREAQQQYEEAAEVQRLHAEHERRAAEREDAIDSPGGDPGARDAAAEQRDHVADLRDAAADRREHRADEREQVQDDREQLQDDRERRFDEATGHSTPAWAPGRRDPSADAKAALRRVEAKLARHRAALDREDVRDGRDQEVIDRESAATARSEPPPESRRSDEAGEESR